MGRYISVYGATKRLRNVLEDSGFYAGPFEKKLFPFFITDDGKVFQEYDVYNSSLRTFTERAKELLLGIQLPQNYYKDNPVTTEQIEEIYGLYEHNNLYSSGAISDRKKAFTNECEKCLDIYVQAANIIQGRLSGSESSAEKVRNDELLNKFSREYSEIRKLPDDSIWTCKVILDATGFLEKVAEIAGVKEHERIVEAVKVLLKRSIL